MLTLGMLQEPGDLAEQLARLPDETQVSAATAALLIRVAPPSARTMEGWR